MLFAHKGWPGAGRAARPKCSLPIHQARPHRDCARRTGLGGWRTWVAYFDTERRHKGRCLHCCLQSEAGLSVLRVPTIQGRREEHKEVRRKGYRRNEGRIAGSGLVTRSQAKGRRGLWLEMGAFYARSRKREIRRLSASKLFIWHSQIVITPQPSARSRRTDRASRARFFSILDDQ